MAKEYENMNLVFYVGTHRLTAALAETLSGNARIVRYAELQHPEGFQKGGVDQLEKAVASVEELLKRLELGEEAFEIPAYVLLSSSQLKMSHFSSSVCYPGYPRVLTSHEVRQVVEQTRNVAPLPLEDWILQAIPESYWVNDLTGVQDPIGLEAQRLAVTLQLFTVPYSVFRNLSRVFDTLELNLKGYFPKTLFLPEGVLNRAEREGEALIIDFTDEATHLVLTEEGKIIQTKSLEVGSRFLTTRLAETWKLSLAEGERLKERFGSLEENLQHGEELIPLREREGLENHQIRRSEFHSALLRTTEDLFSRIHKEAKSLVTQEKRGGPALVLTGGGARLEGIVEFMSRQFQAPVRLGSPRGIEAVAEVLMNPAWVGPAGLLHWIASRTKGESLGLAKENLLERVFLQAKDWLAAYF